MNCKPGDLAVVVGSSQYSGMICEVLYAAPIGSFFLPDGFYAIDGEVGYWVVKFSRKISVQTTNGFRETYYGHGDDKYLRPIRDQDGTDEMIRIAGKPKNNAKPRETSN